MTMTTITLSSRRRQQTSLLENLRNGAIAFLEGLQEGREMERAYSLLSRMSQDELRKRGLARSDITRAVASGYIAR